MRRRKKFRRSKTHFTLVAGTRFSREASRRNSCEAETERIRALERILEDILQLPAHPMQPEPECEEDERAMEAFALRRAAAAAMPSLNPPPAANDEPMTIAHLVMEDALVDAARLR